MAQVSLKNVSQKGGPVQDFSLELRDRELAVLTGPTGCGSSALLRLVAVSGGEIVLGSRAVQALCPADRDVAMVFRHYALFPHLTLSANIAFGLKGRHFPRAEVAKRVKEAAAVAGVEGALDRKPGALPPVEQLRVALARAIVRQPKLILLDEPLAALDTAGRAGMRAELVKLQERLQTTMLVAVQDPLDAMTLGHRVAVLHAGALQQLDTPLRLYSEPANLFVAGFLGQPKMNLLAGRLRAAQEEILFKETGGTVEVKWSHCPALKSYVGQDVVLGVRPEDVHPVAPDAVVKARGARCQGIVDHVEATGAEVYYFVQTGAHTVVIREGAGAEPGGAGRRMAFDIALEKVHLFSAETSARLLLQ